MDPKIVYCSTCKGRAEHIQATLPRNLADNPNARFVLLNYSSPDNLMAYLRDNHAQDIASSQLTVYTHFCDGPFQVAHAKNLAARLGIMDGADILVTLDADNWTGPGFTEFIAEKFEEKAAPGLFLCPNFPLIHSLPHGPERPARGYAGRLAIRSQDFIKMGGYDEEFDTWRGEDMDLIARLERLGYSMRHIDNHFLGVIPHNAEVRFKEYPHAKQYENKQELKAIYAKTNTVVNFGNFGVGVVFRNFDFSDPVELKPVPTRIFGVGLQKTATSSLHGAFQILGYDSLHWGTGHAPRIWHEMNSEGRSKTLEQFYAISDLPIPLLYEKVDKAYPGSKFILTVRNEADWIKSVERLWDPRYNPTRDLWEKWPFTHRIHTALYGQKHFDAEVFLKRYRRHNAEVQDYFKDRPKDLLVKDMAASAGWHDLCWFLGVPEPNAPYPNHNPSYSGRPQIAAAGTFGHWTQSWGTYADSEPLMPNFPAQPFITSAQLHDQQLPTETRAGIDYSAAGIIHGLQAVRTGPPAFAPLRNEAIADPSFARYVIAFLVVALLLSFIVIGALILWRSKGV